VVLLLVTIYIEALTQASREAWLGRVPDSLDRGLRKMLAKGGDRGTPYYQCERGRIESARESE